MKPSWEAMLKGDFWDANAPLGQVPTHTNYFWRTVGGNPQGDMWGICTCEGDASSKKESSEKGEKTMTIAHLCHLYHFAFIDQVIPNKVQKIYTVLVLPTVIQPARWVDSVNTKIQVYRGNNFHYKNKVLLLHLLCKQNGLNDHLTLSLRDISTTFWNI